MAILWAILIILGVTALAVGAILLVRRRAPDGGYFNDGDRAAGVFGVLATGFAILLGFVIFLAFERYDQSRTGARSEALVTAQQFETAQFLPEPVAARLSGELVCYALDVVRREWPAMERGSRGDTINPWGVAMFRTVKGADARTGPQQAAFSKWLDQTSDREDARQDRMHGAEGVIPTAMWIVLFITAGIIVVYMLFFADSGERAVVQGLLIGSVVAVMTVTLLLIGRLDTPYGDGLGSLKPVAMQRTIHLLRQERAAAGRTGPLPCDATGAPLAR